jgi:hypothetical protein
MHKDGPELTVSNGMCSALLTNLIEKSIEAMNMIIVFISYRYIGTLWLLPSFKSADDVLELGLDTIPIQTLELCEKVVFSGTDSRPGYIGRRSDIR